MRPILLILVVCGCTAAPVDPAVVEPAQSCRIRLVTVSNADFFSAETLREIRRVNRALRRHCAG